jgi:DNA-binding CsgD family transcriptional regulator
MDSSPRRNLICDTIDEISRLTSLPEVVATFSHAIARFGFIYFGINGLPPPGTGADPIVLTERTPEGFRDLYIEERFYLVDQMCAYGRSAYRPFRYSEAPYDRAESRAHERFMQALQTFQLGKGLVVPVGRPSNIPTCVWLGGEDPDLDDDTKQAAHVIALFAASKARAIARPPDASPPVSKLTLRERDVLRWISAGKTSWEIAAISGLSERAINKIVGEAMIKLDAVTRTQAVVNAIRVGEIEL